MHPAQVTHPFFALIHQHFMLCDPLQADMLCLAESSSPDAAIPELLNGLQTSGKSADSKGILAGPQTNGTLQVSPLQPA